jgi:hypothetical protein
MTLQKYFSHPSLELFTFFATPTIKLKLGKQIGEELLIANHLDQSSYMMGESETLNSSQITFITVFSVGAQRC